MIRFILIGYILTQLEQVHYIVWPFFWVGFTLFIMFHLYTILTK